MLSSSQRSDSRPFISHIGGHWLTAYFRQLLKLMVWNLESFLTNLFLTSLYLYRQPEMLTEKKTNQSNNKSATHSFYYIFLLSINYIYELHFCETLRITFPLSKWTRSFLGPSETLISWYFVFLSHDLLLEITCCYYYISLGFALKWCQYQKWNIDYF